MDDYEKECNDLQNNIIESPEKLKEEMDILRNKISMVRGESSEIERDILLCKSTTGRINSYIGNVTLCDKVLQNIKAQKIEEDKALEYIKSQNDHREYCETQSKVLDAKQYKLQKQYKIEERNLCELRKNGKESIQKKLFELEKVREKYVKLNSLTNENNKKLNNIIEAINIVQKQVYIYILINRLMMQKINIKKY